MPNINFGGASIQVLQLRAKTFAEIRKFFEQHGFLEIQTPLLVRNPGLEPHLIPFETRLERGMGIQSERTLFLPTSPEYHLKKALALGLPKIYEITRSFRNGEIGREHQPEFHMLEWYRHPGSYQEIASDFEGLLAHLQKALGCDARWGTAQHLTVEEVFKRFADIDLREALSGKTPLWKLASLSEAEDFSTTFNRVMVDKIEKHLGFEGPLFLWDYPASEAALSRKKANDSLFCERFEVYWQGVELANAFGELTDSQEQRRRCEQDQETRLKLYASTPPLDEELFLALDALTHPAAGIAVGVDRLFQCLIDASSLQEVIAFPHQN